MIKRFTAALALSVALLLTAGCGSETAPSGSAEAAGEPTQVEQAPAMTLKDIDGRDVSLSDYEGQVVLLNFWATWCGPCKIEMPWFVDFQRQYKDQGFTVLAVSLDEEFEGVKPFAEEYKLNFPVLLGSDEVADKFGGIVALPTTLIIDKKGQIVTRHTGLVGKDEYEAEIKELL